jgi:UDP-GlcNAc:undecaprenyl-phosphate GlcNAc-1-phosphate transferase
MLWYLASFAVPLAATVTLTPVAGRAAHRFGILDHPKDARHHAHVTPYLGGLAVAAGLLIVGTVAASSSGELLVVLLGGVAMMIVGFEDDRREVGPLFKVGMEVAAAGALWLAGVRAGLFDVVILDLVLTALWVVTVTNALNLIDNMDGLASGSAAIAGLTFFVIAAGNGDYFVGAFALAVTGAAVGFLRHNFPPARIFLGDAGSLFLGFLLAALALKLDLVGQTGFVRATVPLLILGVPLFDMLLVVTARLRDRRPIYVGGTDHTSHRLVFVGFSGRTVAWITYAVQAVLSSMALYVLHGPTTGALVVVGGTALLATICLFLLLRITTEELMPAHGNGNGRGAARDGAELRIRTAQEHP